MSPPLSRRALLKQAAGAVAALATAGCAARGLTRDGRAGGRQAPHLVYTWKGSAFEIGVQHGRTLKNEIVAEAAPGLDALAAARRGSTAKALDAVVAAYEPLFRRHVPRAVEEIRGIGEGSGLGFPFAFYAAIRDGMPHPGEKPPACTALASGRRTSAGGKVLIGQNKDTSAPLERYRIMRMAYDDGRRMILLNYPGWIGNIGLTSAGVSFTGNSRNNIKAASGEFTPGSLFKRLVLEKDSAQDVLAATAGMRFGSGGILLGDAGGRVLFIERAAGREEIVDVSDRAFGHANTILCDSLKDCVAAGGEADRTSPVRQRSLDRLLEARRGPLAVEDLHAVFADHGEFPLSICRHASPEEPWPTTATFVANLTDREIHISIGNPCTAEFRRYTMDF